MADVTAILKANLAEVEERIADSCRRAGRERAELTLVAVTKYADIETSRVLHDLGVRDLGESRPQELWHKAAAIPDAHWHLVGHLQRNKIDRTLPVVRLIHSVDSVRLLEAIDGEAHKQERVVDVLLEFNLSGESAKHGFAESAVPEITEALARARNVNVRGVMTMAALDATAEGTRRTFAAARQLCEGFRNRCVAPHDFRHLSMGMTNDFEIAIDEGATLVRIGSALFRGLEGMTA